MSHSKSVRLEDGRQCFVGVQVLSDVGEDGRETITTGKVEMNPSRVEDPSGIGLSDFDAIAPAVTFAHDQAVRLCEPVWEVEDWKLRRVDVAVDFLGVSDPGRLIAGLAPIFRPYAKRNYLHRDPSKSGAQTLTVGTGAGLVRLYDKHAESEGRALPGTVRYEVEARKGWCEQYAGVETLGELDAAALGRLAMNRWEWSGMGADVGTTSTVVEKVLAADDMTDRERATFLGWLLLQAAGVSAVTGSEALAKFRRRQRLLGIALSDLEGEPDSGFVTRLDYETGWAVTRVA